MLGEDEAAAAYLGRLLGRQLRITTTDGRMFLGSMMCTDKDRNTILSSTFEYRYPSQKDVEAAISSEQPLSPEITAGQSLARADRPATPLPQDAGSNLGDLVVQPAVAVAHGAAAATGGSGGSFGFGSDSGSIKVDMTSRYVGLVVVPGKYITKIELEEFVGRAGGLP